MIGDLKFYVLEWVHNWILWKEYLLLYEILNSDMVFYWRDVKSSHTQSSFILQLKSSIISV